MGELRIGDRVRTPWGDGVVASAVYQGMRGHAYDVAICAKNGGEPAVRVSSWHVDNLEPLPADIPRERVEALHAAVTARLEQLDASRAATWYASEKDIFAACHSDLAEVAEALRLLLEVDP